MTLARTVLPFAVNATAAQSPGDSEETVEAGRTVNRGWRLTVYFALLVAVVAVYAASGKLLHERTVPAPPVVATTSAPASPSASPPATTPSSSTPGW